MPKVTRRLRLRFRDSNGRIISFTVNPPKEPVSVSDAKALMDLIIISNTFYTYTGGAIVEKLDVQLHTEEIEPVTEFG